MAGGTRLSEVFRLHGESLRIESALEGPFLAALPPGSDEPTTVQSFQLPAGSPETSTTVDSLIESGHFEIVHTRGARSIADLVQLKVRESTHVPLVFVASQGELDAVVRIVGAAFADVSGEIRILVEEE